MPLIPTQLQNGEICYGDKYSGLALSLESLILNQHDLAQPRNVLKRFVFMTFSGSYGTGPLEEGAAIKKSHSCRLQFDEPNYFLSAEASTAGVESNESLIPRNR